VLYVVATPIGNLKDITLRALECLRSVSYILCEDTRQSKKLTHHYDIQTPVVSFHLFNEEKRKNQVLDDLKEGKTIALISDAGTPLIEDPGFSLIQACVRENIPVSPLPGPCALIAALSICGLSTCPFYFAGFLPKKEGRLLELLEEVMFQPCTTICYESPNRLIKTLEKIAEIDSERDIAVLRELTKQYETLYAGKPHNVIQEVSKKLCGEIVVVIDGKQRLSNTPFSKKAIKFLLDDLVEQGYSNKDAMQLISNELHIPKKTIYNIHLALK